MPHGRKSRPFDFLGPPPTDSMGDDRSPMLHQRTGKRNGCLPYQKVLLTLLSACTFFSSNDGVQYAYANLTHDHDECPDKGTHWLLDSGASNHFCNDITAFKTLRTAGSARFVRVANGQRILIRGYGEVEWHTTDTDGLPITITLHNVAFVPEFSSNLFRQEMT